MTRAIDWAATVGDEVDEAWSYPLSGNGSATVLGPEPVDEIVDRLHAVVLEVTGKPVQPPPKQRMGFLP